MSRLRPLAIATALVVGLVATGASPAAAAAGNVTSSAYTPPTSVGNATLASAFSDGSEGMYQVFRSGQTRTMIHTLGTGAADAKFNNGTPVSLGIPNALQSTGSIRLVGTTHAATKNWWVVVADMDSRNGVTTGMTITSGTANGTVSFTKDIAGTTLQAKCNEFVPATTAFQSPSLYPRRDGGAWLSILCSSTNTSVFIPLTSSGEIDSSASSFSASAAHGSTALCASQARAIADPTSKSPAPELWIIRTEHNTLQGSQCNAFTNGSSIAPNFVALSSLGISATGTVTRTQLATTPQVQAGGLRVDPGGRVVALVNELTDSTKVKVLRLKADGSLDTSVGNNGFRDLDTGALPSGAISLRTSLIGVITTAERTYFAVQLGDEELNSYSNSSTNPRVHGFRMALMSPADGWVTSFGNGGIGDRVTTTLPESWFGLGGSSATGSTVNAAGRPVNFTITETAANYNVWETISGATGGGEGGTGLGGATKDTGGAPSTGEQSASGGTSGSGRIDSTVYTVLPSTMELNTAFTVLSATTARTQALVSNTGSTCVVSNRHVVAIGVGSCTVVVNRKSDGSTVRTLRTTVSRKSSTKGTKVTVGDPIRFTQASARLSKSARAQITETASAADSAEAIVVVGHAAALTDSPFNFAISRNRANAVRDALRRAKVKVSITATWRGTSDQISTTKTESAQARNRRVVIYLIPTA